MESSNVWIDLCYGGSWETINGSLQYTPVPMNRSFKLPVKKLTYKNLIFRVAKKLSLDVESEFKLTYLKNEKVYMINDNEDVDRFMSFIGISEDSVTLYVVQPRSIEIGSGTGSNQLSSPAPVYGAHNAQQNNYHHQNFMVPSQFITPHFHYQTQYQVNTDHFRSPPIQYLQHSQNPQFFDPNPNQFSDPNFGFHIEDLDDVDDEARNKKVSSSYFDDSDIRQFNDVEDDSDWFWGKTKKEEIVHVGEQIIDDNVEDNVVNTNTIEIHT